MNYGQVRDQALKLINQYSVAGEKVALSYNNQEDYVLRIPGLVNDCMMEIATTARKIPATLILSYDLDYDFIGNYTRFQLPDDFYQFKTGDTLVTTAEGFTFHTNLYRIQGRNYLLIPSRELERGQTYTITYYRYPTMLPEKPADDAALDNVPETHYAIPYYVAAYLVIYDDAFQYASFYNKYEDRLQKMMPDISAEAHPVADVYGGFGDLGWT